MGAAGAAGAMTLSGDERRALGLVALLLAASAAARLRPAPPPAAVAAPAVDVPAQHRRADSLAATDAEAHRPLRPGETIDPNAASATELRRLPGIGPALAARIVAYRDSAGPFRKPTDLARVKGIGARTLARLQPFLRLSP